MLRVHSSISQSALSENRLRLDIQRKMIVKNLSAIAKFLATEDSFFEHVLSILVKSVEGGLASIRACPINFKRSASVEDLSDGPWAVLKLPQN